MTGFEELYRLYYEDVFRFLRGLARDEVLAEELTAETFFRAIKGLDRFRGECGVYVWLCQIGKHCYYSHQKRQKRLDSGEAPGDAATEENLEELMLDKDMAFRLHQLLHGLKEPYREVFSLRVFGELSFRQIGALFGKTDHWACVVYHRAKTAIRNGLEDSHET